MWRSVSESCFWTIAFVWKRSFDIQSFVMHYQSENKWTIDFVFQLSARITNLKKNGPLIFSSSTRPDGIVRLQKGGIYKTINCNSKK